MKYILIYLSFVLIYTNTLLAKDNKKRKADDTREVVLYLGEAMIKIHIMLNNREIKIYDWLKYSWYKNNMILETRGAYDGKLLHGIYTEYHPNKNISKRGEFKYGIKVGKWKEWHGNGEIKEIAYWKKGLKHGKHTQYNDNGEKIKQYRYKNGKEKIDKQPKVKVKLNNEFKENNNTSKEKREKKIPKQAKNKSEKKLPTPKKVKTKTAKVPNESK